MSFSSHFKLALVAHQDDLMRLPFHGDLTSNPDKGFMHDGAITILLDSVSGSVVRKTCMVGENFSIATLDLRVDRLRPPIPNVDIYAKGDCYRVSQNIAFVRAWAYEQAIADPVATSVGTFMLGSRKKSD